MLEADTPDLRYNTETSRQDLNDHIYDPDIHILDCSTRKLLPTIILNDGIIHEVISLGRTLAPNLHLRHVDIECHDPETDVFQTGMITHL